MRLQPLELRLEQSPRAVAPAQRPIHVLFVLHSMCIGGAEKQVVSLINGMDKSRYLFSLLAIKSAERIFNQASEVLLRQIEPGGCDDRVACLDVVKSLEPRAVFQLARYIDDNEIDVVVCTNMYTLLYGWLARLACRRKVRTVEVFHTSDFGSPRERLLMQLYKPLVRMTDLVVYVSHAQARHWRGQGLRAQREAVIHNGIDVDRFRDVWSSADKLAYRRSQGFEAQDYVIGLCALMRPEKAHGDLLAALARLRQEGMNVKGLLIGDGPERARVEAAIERYGVGEHVRITGYVEDVRPAIAACDVMAITSNPVETFSIAALECMALGKPMVMTDLGGAPEQVTPGSNGLLYPAKSIDDLADCLRRLADPQSRAEMGRQAASRVARDFSIHKMVRSYERVLAELCGRNFNVVNMI
jgi:glycosyltransferase involved in cell wall biosynthesis